MLQHSENIVFNSILECAGGIAFQWWCGTHVASESEGEGKQFETETNASASGVCFALRISSEVTRL